jgi:hypothetical protein
VINSKVQATPDHFYETRTKTGKLPLPSENLGKEIGIDAEDNDDVVASQEGVFYGKPPRFAIANGNWIGMLPAEFRDISRTDEMSISLKVPIFI